MSQGRHGAAAAGRVGGGEHSPAVSSGEKRIFWRARPAAGFPILASNQGARPPPPHVGWRADRRAARGGGSRPRGDLGRRAGGASERPSGGVHRVPASSARPARARSRRRGGGRRARAGAARVVPRHRRRRARARARRAKWRGEPESRATAPARRATRRAPRASSRRNPRWIAGGAREAPRGARAEAPGSSAHFSPRANLAGAQNPGWRDRARDRARRFGRSRARSRLGASRAARRTHSLSDRAREGEVRDAPGCPCRPRRVAPSARTDRFGGEGMRSRLALPRSGCSSEERRGDARATSARGR